MTKRVLKITIPIVFVAGLILYFVLPRMYTMFDIEKKARISINDQIIIAEVAADRESQEEGLSGRDSLGINEGMLFLFPESDYHLFWMKGMRFPIDIVWISGQEIVGITENVKPEPNKSREELTIYSPPEAVDKVLEISAGRSDLMNLKEGDMATFESIVPGALRID